MCFSGHHTSYTTILFSHHIIKVGENQIKRPQSFKTNNTVNGVTPFDKDSSTTEETTTDPEPRM